jgi:hypothetical protein
MASSFMSSMLVSTSGTGNFDRCASISTRALQPVTIQQEAIAADIKPDLKCPHVKRQVSSEHRSGACFLHTPAVLMSPAAFLGSLVSSVLKQ